MMPHPSVETPVSQLDPNVDYSFHLMQQECQMRLASLSKQYQLQLAKQKQFYELNQWKLGQEKRNLEEEIKQIHQNYRRIKQHNAKMGKIHCQICSDGQVIKHQQKILKCVEDNHNKCISNKKEMLKQIEDLTFKVQFLQTENNELEEENCKLNKQFRASKKQKDALERQIQDKSKELQEKDRVWTNKCKQVEWQVKKLSQENQRLEKNVEYYRCRQVIRPPQPQPQLQSQSQPSQPQPPFNQIRSFEIEDTQSVASSVPPSVPSSVKSSLLQTNMENIPKSYSFGVSKAQAKKDYFGTKKDYVGPKYGENEGAFTATSFKFSSGIMNSKDKENNELKFRYL